MTSRKSPVGRRSQAGIKRVSSPSPGWEAVFRVLHDPGVILGPDFSLLHTNRAAQEAVELSKQELKGRHCYDVFHGTHAPPPGCPLAKLNASKHAETAEMEVELLRRAYRISCPPILDENGKIQSVIHPATDITKRMQTSLGGSPLSHFLAMRLNTSETLQPSLCKEAKSKPGECY